jgi:hypothetical protein
MLFTAVEPISGLDHGAGPLELNGLPSNRYRLHTPIPLNNYHKNPIVIRVM